MAEVTQAQIEEKLATYVDPYLERDLVSTKCVKDISVDGDSASVSVVFPPRFLHTRPRRASSTSRGSRTFSPLPRARAVWASQPPQ